jgi:O-antigen/teichoic acid export membrane protein
MSVLLGDIYSESLPIFLVTSLGAAATTAFGFLSILVHSIRLPSISLYINLFTLLAFVPLGSILMVKEGLFYMTIWYAILVVIGEAIKVITINRYARTLQGSNK